MELISKIDSPYIVKVYEFFETDSEKISVHEFIDGQTLD